MATMKLSFLLVVLFLARDTKQITKVETIAFGAGCFWGLEYELQQIEGVISTKCIYTNIGTEAVLVKYDHEVVQLDNLFAGFVKVYKPGVNYRRPYRPTIQFFDTSLSEAVDELVKKYDLENVSVGTLHGYTEAEGFHQNRFLIKNRQLCR
ncbi:MAG: peptide-methionine (S)-S-oxide reductase [Lentisphaeraceae bacterium]|nr:peptide-methionine (S)-S-oxide reductase [Lentisphaeraceae bacterium]